MLYPAAGLQTAAPSHGSLREITGPAMHTGATVTDGQGRTFTVGQDLGRGLWARTVALRDAQGRDVVAKIALSRDDFPADLPLPEGVLEATVSALDEQAAWLREGRYPFLPKLLDRTVIEGRAVLLMPRYANTLERRLQGNVPLGEALDLLLEVSERLAQIHKDGRVHGDLRPSNVLINDQGRVVLADWLGPTAMKWRARLTQLAPADRGVYAPPEAGESPRPVWDTWALGLALYRAATLPAGAPDPRRHAKVELPRTGLDKVQLAALKDRALDRLQLERANPRFTARVAERVAALVSRAISEAAEPSPPYRFLDGGALHPRLAELHGLVFPRIADVGKLLHGADAREGRYEGGATVTFTISVGVSTEAATHDDLACGIQILDLDAVGDARVAVPEARYTVKSHPSGRMRFEFELPGLAPGRYRANIAFLVKDGSGEPEIASGDFEVRPQPGYIPPPREPIAGGPSPLQFPGRASGEPIRPSAAQEDSLDVELTDEEAHAAAVHALPARPRPLGDLPSPTPSVTSADLSPDPDALVRDPDFPMPIAPSQPGVALGPAPRFGEPARSPHHDPGTHPGPDTRTVRDEPPTKASHPAPAPQSSAPSLAAPKPQVAAPQPTAVAAPPPPRPGATARPTPIPLGKPAVGKAQPAPMEVSGWSEPSQWEELPGPDEPAPGADPSAWLPSHDAHTDELPDWGSSAGRPQRGLAESARAFVARDKFLILMIALGMVLCVLLAFVLLLRALL